MSEGNIVSIVPKPHPDQEPSQALVEWLEETLELAKTGEIQGMAGAARFSDGSATYHIMGWAGGFTLQGAMATAAHMLAENNAGVE